MVFNCLAVPLFRMFGSMCLDVSLWGREAALQNPGALWLVSALAG